MNRRISALLLLFGGVLAGCDKTSRPYDSSRPVTAIRVGSYTPAETATRYTAVVVPNRQVDLSFKTAGYVEWLAQRNSAAGGTRPLDAGDMVVAGWSLARLRTPEMRSQVDQAGSAVSSAMATQKSAEAQLDQARADVEHAEADWMRAQSLYAQAALTKPDYEAAKKKHLVAQAEVAEAKEAIATQSARVYAATAQRREARALLADTELHAPFDGVIVSRNINIGSLVAEGATAFSFADVNRVKVAFSVPDIALHSLHLGDHLPVSCDAVSSELLTGTVTLIAATADAQSSTFRIEVTLANSDHHIHPGMVAAVTMPTSKNSVLPEASIPLNALVHRPEMKDSYGVFAVVQEGTKKIARLRLIQLGEIHGDSAEVLKGLEPGTEVILMGGDTLLDGDAITDVGEGAKL